MTTEEIKVFLLKLKPQDITKRFVDEWFSHTYDTKAQKVIAPKISFQEEFILKKGEYVNTEDVKTNAGQFIINKCLYERTPRIQAVVGYVAQPFNKDTVLSIESKMSKASTEGKILPEDWAVYLNCIQWFGNTLNTNVSCSFTPSTTKVLPEVQRAREKLYKENAEALAKGDMVTALKIEKELLAIAKDSLKDNVGMTIYDSQCKPKFGNQYKNTFVTRGPIWMPHKEEFEIGKTAFIDGLQKEDIPQYGTSVTNGAYAKACTTAIAGYVVKKLFSTYQGVILDERGTDCHTKGYRIVTIDKSNADKLKNRYIIEGTKLVQLTGDVMPKYIGKTVKMRSPLYCLGDKLCNKCAGEAFYIQGIKNIGLTASSIGSCFLNLLMKAFHDSTTKLITIKPEDIFSD